MSLVPLIGYGPDIDPTTPGVLTDCTALVPSLKGMKGAPSAVDVGGAALAARGQGAFLGKKLDGTSRLFAGTATGLYEFQSLAWTNRSGATYNLGTDTRWRFAQYGDVSLATAKTDKLQYLTSGTTFGDASVSAPKAAIVETVGNFVFLFDTNETSYGDSPSRWWCSGIGDYTDWTPAIATQCATGTLSSSPGKIRAGRRFGDGIVAYKERSMFVGIYTGAPQVWDFREVPGEIGALSQEAVVNVGTAENPRHIFMGFDDFYSFDGSRPVPIGTPVKETVFRSLNTTRSEQCAALHDRQNSRIYFYYPVSDASTIDSCVVYNYRTNKWGRDDRTIECVTDYATPSITYADIGSYYSTYADLPNVSYDSFLAASGYVYPAVFNTSHKIITLSGTPMASTMTTGDVGDDNTYTCLSRVKPRYLSNPTTATMTNYYRDNLSDSLTAGTTTTESSRRFDLLIEARWHRLLFSFTGDVELSAIGLKGEQGGDE